MIVISKQPAVHRRTLLRGLGASLSLPFLEAMRPASARAASSPRRLVFVYVPNGVIMKEWVPTQVGSNYELSPTLQALQPFKSEMLVLSGLRHRNGEALGDGPGDHARAAASYLTGAHPKKSATELRVGKSVDQVAAEVAGKGTRLPSLEMSCERGQLSGACDSGYSCAYQNAFSWRSETSPLPAEVNPRFVFERLFGAEGSGKDEVRARMQRDRSILDFVASDAQRLVRRLGGADKHKLDEYLTAVRAVEQQLDRGLENPAAPPPTGTQRPNQPAGFEDHLRLMSDLLVLALQSDSTRVVTLLFGRELGNRTFPWLGAHSGHHDTSHHQNNAEKVATLSRIDKFYVERLAYLLGRLREVREGEGTLLDNSLLVYGSGLSDGNKHLHNNLPTLLIGRGGGTVRPGRHVQLPNDTPMCNLWLSLLERMDVNAKSFGDSTGAIAELA